MSNRASINERIVAGIIGATFGGIGLTVLISMWAMPFHSFHSPPLFFRFFASFIALPFVALGGAGLFTLFTGISTAPKSSVEKMQNSMQTMMSKHVKTTRTGSLRQVCPNCGAPRGEVEVSPSGDVKCPHCKAWFNVFEESQ
ncbi:hypothetical protein [Rubinisphaera italica]|uniref:Uncharacterized protein n=1 Tax=Rubinisphaera italica TaxID=2527969 RepID=A0A5C5XHR3_9PLAN|nr:hypothetical protein [Rubinisphaera italica]TWT62249.1 hypothetical protein Pan54_29900 [Rubinisphaera italica]